MSEPETAPTAGDCADDARCAVTGRRDFLIDALRGRDGPLSVIDFAARSRLSEAYVASAEAVGIRRNDDYNGAEQEGVGYYQNTMKNGRRWSAHRAFLKPAMKRANLRVITHAQSPRCSR